MKIAIVHTPLTVSAGAEKVVLVVAGRLQRMGHRVHIYTNAYSKECYPELAKGLEIIVIKNLLRFLPSYYSHLFGFLVMIPHLIKNRYDIINPHNFPSEWVALPIKKLRKNLKIVWFCHEPPFWFIYSSNPKYRKIIDYPLFEILEKLAVSLIDIILVMSKKNVRSVKNVYDRSSSIVYEGVDYKYIHEASNKYLPTIVNNLDKSTKVILSVGTICDYKKQKLILNSLIPLLKDYDNCVLLFVGRGNIDGLNEIAKNNKIINKVLFINSMISDFELASIYNRANVLVFSANQSWGLVVTEAMASGCAVVVNELAGVSEIIDHGVSGLLHKHDDAQDIYDKVKELIENNRLRSTIALNAKNLIVNNYSWDSHIDGLLTIYRKLLS